MSGLMGVTRVEVPLGLALETYAHLRRVGERASEGFALWAGELAGSTFSVRETIIPAQREVCDQHGGIGVVVEGAELHRLNLWQYERGMTLIAQLHSHPGKAYHSPTDDAFPIATAIGSLSLVVPDFANTPFALDQCAVYRLSALGLWIRLDALQAGELIAIGG